MGRARIGYAAMLEQFGPSEVVDYTVAAEQAAKAGAPISLAEYSLAGIPVSLVTLLIGAGWLLVLA